MPLGVLVWGCLRWRWRDPMLFSSGLALTVLSQMGIAIIACLSYNMLLGRGGMSFGHAVYSGLGALSPSMRSIPRQWGTADPGFAHSGGGGLAGMGFASAVWLCHYAQGRDHVLHDHAGLGRAGFAMSLMVPEFFGGEGGYIGQPGRRATGHGHHIRPRHSGVLPDRRLHFVCVVAMFAFTRARWAHAQRGA